MLCSEIYLEADRFVSCRFSRRRQAADFCRARVVQALLKDLYDLNKKAEPEKNWLKPFTNTDSEVLLQAYLMLPLPPLLLDKIRLRTRMCRSTDLHRQRQS